MEDLNILEKRYMEFINLCDEVEKELDNENVLKENLRNKILEIVSNETISRSECYWRIKNLLNS